MILLTGFYHDPDARRRDELLECLKRNAANDLIDEVRIFIEDPTAHEMISSSVDQRKVTPVPLERRMTYRDLFDYANQHLKPGETVIVANADIYFDETLARLDGYDLNGKLLCLSRWDVRADGSLEFFEHPFSQDAWIFKTPLPAIDCDFYLGKPACDNRLAWEAEHAGLQVINPARSIRACHLHISEVRRYSERERLPGPVKGVPAMGLETPYPSERGTPPELDCAVVAFSDRIGHTIAEFAAGVSSHNNEERPIQNVPEQLRGLQFTQEVAYKNSAFEIEFLSTGKLYVLVGNDWSGHEVAVDWLRRVGFREPIPFIRTLGDVGFEVWSLAGEKGERHMIPAQVILATRELVKRDVARLRPAQISETKHMSQLGQDIFIDEYFNGKRDGVFVEIGAYDGLTISNTLMLERDRGWTGICIEPLPDIFDALRQNRSCICVQACIGNRDESEVEFLAVESKVVRTRMLSGVLSEYDPRHLARVDSELGEFGGSKCVIRVPMRRLHTVLEEHSVGHVDYLSIDTEGSELSIINSTNLSAIGNPCIMVENNYDDPALDAAFNVQGYRLHTIIEWDRFYVHEEWISER